MLNPNRFYTYAYLREDRTPYYIGKGSYNRAYEKRKYEIRPPKDKSRIIFLKQNLTKEDAFKHEIYMIAVFGRKDLGTGVLRNKTNGGEGCSGYILTEENKRKISERQRCEGNSFYGKTHSQETIEKMRVIKTGKTQSQETRDKIAATKIGIPRSQETIEKMRAANIGKTLPQETKNKISEAISGEKHYMFGKTLSQEIKDKIRVGISGENNPKSNWWRITFSDGRVIERCGLSNWVKENGYNVGSVYELYKKRRKRHKDIVSVEKLENKPLHKINYDV
jgi:hypothetical protein